MFVILEGPQHLYQLTTRPRKASGGSGSTLSRGVAWLLYQSQRHTRSAVDLSGGGISHISKAYAARRRGPPYPTTGLKPRRARLKISMEDPAERPHATSGLESRRTPSGPVQVDTAQVSLRRCGY